MEIKLYKNDIPDDVDLGKVIAIDTETLGLNLVRDRLCLVQMSSGDGCAHLVQFESGEQDSYSAPNLKARLTKITVKEKIKPKLYNSVFNFSFCMLFINS